VTDRSHSVTVSKRATMVPDAPLVSNTIRYHRSILVMALKQAHRWGAAYQHVATLVDPPSAKKYKLKTFDPAQADKLLEALKGERLGLCLRLRLHSGCAAVRLWGCAGRVWTSRGKRCASLSSGACGARDHIRTQDHKLTAHPAAT
jgi:hypothetical protein